jgi:hypothetical protein
VVCLRGEGEGVWPKENHIELNTKSFFSFERTISSQVSLIAVNAKTNTSGNVVIIGATKLIRGIS